MRWTPTNSRLLSPPQKYRIEGGVETSEDLLYVLGVL
jgi:hypothetical protein